MANPSFPSQSAQKVANLWNNQYASADEGAFFIVNTPTPGTAVAMVQAVQDDAATAGAHGQAAPLIYIRNKAAAGDPNGKSIYLQYIRLLIGSQAWTSATDVNFSLRADSTERWTSGGTLYVPTNANTGSSVASNAGVYFGANVTALPSANQRLLSHGQIQGTIPLPKDQWLFTFGDVSGPTNMLGASAIKNITIPCGPVVVAPGWNVQLDIWAGSLGAVAPTFELEMGFVERVSGL